MSTPAELARRVAALEQRVAAAEHRRPSGPMVSTAYGATSVRPYQVGLPVETTGPFDPDVGYSWKARVLDPTLSAGQVKSSDATPTGKYAYTIGNDENIPTGTPGWLEPDPQSRGYLFTPARPHSSCHATGTTSVNLVDPDVWYGVHRVEIPATGAYHVLYTAGAFGVTAAPHDGAAAVVGVRLVECGAAAQLTGMHGVGLYFVDVAAESLVPGPARGNFTMSLFREFEAGDVVELQAVRVEFSREWLTATAYGRIDLVPMPAFIEGPCDADEGCADGGSGSGSPGGGDEGNPGGPDPETPIDFGDEATLTISDATGDCTCLNGEEATLARVSPTQWNGVGEIDSSGCPENPDATDNVGISWSGDGWRLLGLYDGLDCEFLGQDDATYTVMLRATATAGVGQSVCTGTFVVTVVGVGP